jgi:hypothetical protein
MNSKIASLKPHEYVDLRYQVSMQRKRETNIHVFYMISTKVKTQVIDILDFKYRMVVK